MLVLITIAIGAITLANIRSRINSSRQAELNRLQRIVELMESSRFPLTSSVLEDMKSLSGAEFVLQDASGQIISRTSAAPDKAARDEFPTDAPSTPTPSVYESLAGNSFYHTWVNRNPDRNLLSSRGQLHIFVPRQTESSIWWQSSKSPLLIALIGLPLTLIVSIAMASQVTRPLAKLKDQVQQIAAGDITQIPPISRNDEISDLGHSINDMAAKLHDNEVELLKNERLRNMLQFGNSIAHHLRNSNTGCRMAIELLASDHKELHQSENYQVAVRQLGLMDSYIKRFLLFSKNSVESPAKERVHQVNLDEILERVVFLVRPSAQHLGVELSVVTNSDESTIAMNSEDAEQLMMNLITNAINAASQRPKDASESPYVAVKLDVERGRATFSVTDNGAGPPEEIAETIFQPFVTGSHEGTGLGLSLVQDIANRINGRVDWSRDHSSTTFVFETDAPEPG